MLKLNALIILTTLSVVTPTLYAEDDMMNTTSGNTMQNNDQQSAPMQQMQEEMKKLQEMHDQLMNAKTPEEKKALLKTQMPEIQHGMDIMQKMGGETATNPEMMGKRMKMMQTMMQMMMDRQKMMIDNGMMGCSMMKGE
ncbi:type IV secretion protein Dot [Legionella maioricensis]|uniref:Type IV secretion protein Dot n=1 Tax=Legionella maioricensis TaxID=2896528 RepID=A0A9X2CYY4_9GAMM|nr:type IV secretion protein Dot [Legionella maioricensis]MCL9682872.1 type IV secretion protein Dot [Legionella maioricensis]MCL9686500.1 type IV secretion protein Dot [Legionella maioricensis]